MTGNTADIDLPQSDARIVPVDDTVWDLFRLAGTLDEKRKHIFLRVLAETGNSKLACNAAGYRNMAPINKALKQDSNFADAFAEAVEAASEFLEAEAVRRAVQGVKKAIYYKGELIDHEVVYSDMLLALLLKAAKPDKYAERTKNTSSVNVRVGVAVLPATVKDVTTWERNSAVVHEQQKRLNAPGPVVDAEFREVGTPLVRG